MLCLAILLLAVSQAVKQEWGINLDIWEHAAAARQLGADPLHPGHPIFNVDEPHQFYSPYALALGLIARISGLSIVTVLAAAGLANLLLFTAALWLFVDRLLKRRQAATYALLFVLFLWGANAWTFSGFFHFRILPFVLPYPATFAAALVLLTLWIHLRFLASGNPRYLIPELLLTTVVLLTHPVDIVVLATGMVGLTASASGGQLTRRMLLMLATLALATLLAMLWPYFSLVDLLLGSDNQLYREQVNADDRNMYVAVLGRIWPMLVVLPVMCKRLLKRPCDGLVLWLVGLLLAYGFGWISGIWSLGRLISAAMLVGAIVLADERVKATEFLVTASPVRRCARRGVQVGTVALLAVGAFYARNGFAVLPDPVLAWIPENWVGDEVVLVDLSDYEFLTATVGDGAVVMADGFTPLAVAAYGGKVVSVPRPEAFVDTVDRAVDSARFFDVATPKPVRQEILARYGVSFILLANDDLARSPDTYAPVLELGTVAYRNGRFTVVRPAPISPPSAP